MPKKNLYALLVGINEYITPPTPLNGCVADIERVEAYLKKEKDLQPNIKKLLNSEATKSNIIRHFRNHLGQAKAGDTVLFYFSGHGCQEHANAVWTSEHDSRLECLVCHNSEKQFLLADKELRFLIHELHQKEADVHIVTIFDCCHSGDNTRGEYLITTDEAQERRYAWAAPERAWEDFVFGAALPIETFKGKHISEVLPEGKHIQMAACLSNESAWEIGGQGIFTKNLLEVLDRSEGDVSYYDLKSRIKHYVKFQKPQSPQLYVQGQDNQDFFLTFLGKDRQSKPMYARVYHRRGQLSMDMGSAQGVSNWAEKVQVELEDGRTVALKIKEVQHAKTILEADRKTLRLLSEGKEYKGYIDGFMSAPLSIYIKDEEGDEALLATVKDKIENISNLTLVDDPTQNDYTVVIRNGTFRITPNDDYVRPMVEAVSIEDPNRLVAQLDHISQWTYIKEFKNESPTFFRNNNFITLQVYQQRQDGTWAAIEQQRDTVDISTRKTADGWTNQIKIKLTNTSNKDLYCSLLYLSSSFGTMFLLDQTTTLLAANQSVWAWESENRAVPIQLEDHTLEYNWQAEMHHLKVMVSTTDALNPEAFLLENLPTPETLEGTKNSTRGIARRSKPAPDWTTFTVNLRIPNPMYNKISESKLREMLHHPVLSEYALQLYFDADWNKGIKVKETIEILNLEEADRSFVTDSLLSLGNRFSKRKRRKRFEKNIEKFPDRILMISEGDSWFQHPLLTDTIDHLSMRHNIYSLGAAGDELANYIQTNDFEEAINYLTENYITSERPLKYLLLSGGGNDIVGEEMQGFLNADHANLPITEGTKRYLLASFFEQLEKLMTYVKRICEMVQEKVPEIQVLMHTYDYIVPNLDKGWVGKYMMDIGLEDENERQSLANFMIDQYYEALEQLADQIPNLQIIDVRNTVAPHQWDDEIHPTSLGFGLVAERFNEVIDREMSYTN